MAMPDIGSIGIVDLMIGFPTTKTAETYAFLQPGLRDDESREMQFPAEYMFKDVPERVADEDDTTAVATTLEQMDRFGIEIGLVGLGSAATAHALDEHPDRFVASLEIDPNRISKTVDRIREAHARHGIKAVSTFPSGCNPPVP
ncbi:MAG: hypothetical protein R3249_03610, partial [Nitriliruptorales bacterium]|nr:hypothetical protein [Nitriliruptorales bacterium]